MVLNDLYEILKSRKNPKMLIGFTGFVGSGKTYFSREFAQFLNEKNINSIHFNMDVYNSSTRAERNLVIESLKENYDKNWPRRAYPQDEILIKNHLTNIRESKSFSANNLCNPSTKELNFPIKFLFNGYSTIVKIGENEKKYSGNNFWILCDGVKLIKYKDYFDCLIFLKADYEIRFNRLLKRNNKLPSPAKIRKDLFDDLESNLIEEYKLHENNQDVDIIIDNNNFDNRTIIKREY